MKRICLIIFALICLCFAGTVHAKRDKASENLLARVCPGNDGRITFDVKPERGDTDYFEIESKSGKPHITGNSSVSIATGLNWYLKHFCGRPSTGNFQVKSWSKMINYYDPATTLKAATLMAAADRLRGNNNYEYDLVDVTRQALADQGRRQYQRAMSDYRTFSRDDFKKSSRRFLDMILLQDRLLSTRPEFRLGSWIEAERGLGTTEDEKDLYEWSARVQITTWGNRECADKGGLRDYAHKEWQGLLRDFYYPRWERWMKALAGQVDQDALPRPDALGGGPNANKTSSELFAMALPSAPVIDWYEMEEPWTLAKGGYSAEAEGDPVATAKEVLLFLGNQD